MAAILGDHHNEMVAMLEGIEFFSHAKTIFCSKKIAKLLTTMLLLVAGLSVRFQVSGYMQLVGQELNS